VIDETIVTHWQRETVVATVPIGPDVPSLKSNRNDRLDAITIAVAIVRHWPWPTSDTNVSEQRRTSTWVLAFAGVSRGLSLCSLFEYILFLDIRPFLSNLKFEQRGRQIFALIDNSKATLPFFGRNDFYGRLMEWSMKDEAFQDADVSLRRRTPDPHFLNRM